MSRSLLVRRVPLICLCIYIYLFKGQESFKTNPKGPAVFQNHMQMLQSLGCKFRSRTFKKDKKKVPGVVSLWLSGRVSPHSCFFSGCWCLWLHAGNPHPSGVVPGLTPARAFGRCDAPRPFLKCNAMKRPPWRWQQGWLGGVSRFFYDIF